MSEIELFQEQDRYFIKSFIIDADLNLNYWQATDAAIDEYLGTFIDKPFVITPDFGHPDAVDGNDLYVQQEKYRVGKIIEVGREANGTAWAISEITTDEGKRMIQDGEVRFVSPSITFNTATDLISVQGKEIITKFNAAHLAGVKEPAYGMQKAQIKGACSGSPGTCKPQLSKVQASIDKSTCGKVITIHEGSTVRMVKNASECMEKCLRIKAEQGISLDDSTIAGCYSNCAGNTDDVDSEGESEINVNINVESGQEEPVKPTNVCTKCDTGKCQCSSNKAKDEDESMTDETDQKDQKKSNEEELEDKRKEEARKAEEEKKDEKEAEEDKDKTDPLNAEEEEDDKKDARIKALEAELHAEKTSFITQIVEAKKSAGHILEAEVAGTTKMLQAETLVTLKSLAAEYIQMAEANTKPGKPYTVLEFSNAKADSGEAFLKTLGAKSD